jgi:hypothetical protein
MTLNKNYLLENYTLDNCEINIILSSKNPKKTLDVFLNIDSAIKEKDIMQLRYELNKVIKNYKNGS